MAFLRTSPHFRALSVAVALGGSLLTVRAAKQEREPPELTSATSDLLNSDFRPAYDNKEWDKAVATLDHVLAKAPADSYDAAYSYKVEAMINIQNKNNLPKGLEQLQQAMAIDDQKHYFDEKDVQEILYTIAQISFNEAASTKDNDAKPRLFATTTSTLDRWLQHADPSSLTQENYYFLAVVYFTLGQGTEVNGVQKTDRPNLEKAMVWIDKGLRSAPHPRETFFQMKVAGLYQLNQFKEMADFLELEVKMKPDSKNNWQELEQIYLQLASVAEEKKDTKAATAYDVRAILTLERAQKLGFMTSPKENLSLVQTYSNINQYAIACDLLHKGLMENTIESTPQNWQILGGWYQLIHRDDKAVETFVTAAKLFPTNGEIEYQVAQVYLGMGNEKGAYEHMKICIAKGGTEKPHVGLLLYAYTAMDLQKFDEAMKAAADAAVAAKKANAPEAVKQAQKIQDAVKGNLQDIENRRTQGQTK
jgi:hypothetical protein